MKLFNFRVFTILFFFLIFTTASYAQLYGDVAPTDCDVDGNDLAAWIVAGAPAGMDVAAFAANYGKSTCQSQSDLQGVWNFINFRTGSGVWSNTIAGWERGNVTIANDGMITHNSYSDNLGGSMPTATLVLTMDTSGNIAQTKNGVQDDFHGRLASDKNVMVGVQTSGDAHGDQQMNISVRQNVTSFSNADISSLSFVYHQFDSASGNHWRYGPGSINNDRQVSITSCTSSSGSCTPPGTNFTTLSIDTSTGIVSASNDPTLQGVMTPDKKTIFITLNNGTTYPPILMVMQINGQTFSQTDAAGIWHQLGINSRPGWFYATLSISNSGLLTFSSHLDQSGSTALPPSDTVSLSSDGTVTSTNLSVNGAMNYNKDMFIGTDTSIRSSTTADFWIFMKD